MWTKVLILHGWIFMLHLKLHLMKGVDILVLLLILPIFFKLHHPRHTCSYCKEVLYMSYGIVYSTTSIKPPLLKLRIMLLPWSKKDLVDTHNEAFDFKNIEVRDMQAWLPHRTRLYPCESNHFLSKNCIRHTCISKANSSSPLFLCHQGIWYSSIEPN